MLNNSELPTHIVDHINSYKKLSQKDIVLIVDNNLKYKISFYSTLLIALIFAPCILLAQAYEFRPSLLQGIDLGLVLIAFLITMLMLEFKVLPYIESKISKRMPHRGYRHIKLNSLMELNDNQYDRLFAMCGRYPPLNVKVNELLYHYGKITVADYYALGIEELELLMGKAMAAQVIGTR